MIPRRNRLDLNTPAELAIHNAIQEVDKVGADPKLTEVTIMLVKAKELLSDSVDNTESKQQIIKIMEDCKEEQTTLGKGVQKATLIQQTIKSLEEINSVLYGINKRLEDLTLKTGLCSGEPDSGDTCEPGDNAYTTRLLNNLKIIDTRLNLITDRITDLEKFI